MLALCCTVIGLAFLLRVRGDQRVELSVFPGRPAPETCLSRSLWGVHCPGCGLTRSFIYLAQGNPAASFAVNRVGWLLALATLIQLPYRSFMLYQVSLPGQREPIPPIVYRLFSSVLIFALSGNWLLKMFGI